MQRDVKSARPNIPMCLACILFCLTLISVYITGGLYAKYTVSSNMPDSARVMRFGDITLTETGDFQQDGTLIIIPGVDLTKKACIDFDGSEASTYIFTEITLSSDWIPNADNSGFAVKNGEKLPLEWHVDSSWSFLKSEGNTYIYYMELSPNSTLTEKNIIADDGRIYVSNLITKKEIADMNSISIQFRVTAVQSDGQKTPAEAWGSISAEGK